MIKKYTVAKFNIEIDIDYDEFFFDRLKDYENDFGNGTDIFIKVQRTKDIISPSYKNLVKIGKAKYSCKIDGCDALINYDDNTSKIIAVTKFNQSYTNVEILSYDITQDYDYPISHFNFNLVGNAMHYVCAMNNAFVFHSSALCTDDGGVIFSAPSGTGKTTHTSLWLKEFSDALMINDDTPILKYDTDGKFLLCGTPWAGTSGVNANKNVKLNAIVFINRSEENTIVLLDKKEAVKKIFSTLVTPLNSAMHLKYLDTINEIIKCVNVYNLSCNMNPEAAHIAREFISKTIKQGEKL